MAKAKARYRANLSKAAQRFCWSHAMRAPASKRVSKKPARVDVRLRESA
jgi:hypothetical protein